MTVHFTISIPDPAWSDPNTLLTELQALLPSPLPPDLAVHVEPPHDTQVTWSEDIAPTPANLAALRQRIIKDLVLWQNIWRLP